jgi:hypothetical protein
MEIRRQIDERMQSFGAEPLIEDPEPLKIGKRGGVRIALKLDDLPWQLDDSCHDEFRMPAKSFFWKDDTESILGYKCKFVVKPKEDTDNIHVIASVSYTEDEQKPSRSVLLNGRASICGSSPRHMSSCSFNSYKFNIANSSDVLIGSDNLIDKRTVSRPRDQSQPDVDSVIPNTMTDDCDSRGVGPHSLRVIATSRTEKYHQVVPECGQQENELYLSFPREGGRLAPPRCIIEYLGCNNATVIKSSEGTRISDPFVVRTRKPCWPHPDTVTVLIKNNDGNLVGHCRLSFGATSLPVIRSITVTAVSANESDSESDDLQRCEKDGMARSMDSHWEEGILCTVNIVYMHALNSTDNCRIS